MCFSAPLRVYCCERSSSGLSGSFHEGQRSNCFMARDKHTPVIDPEWLLRSPYLVKLLYSKWLAPGRSLPESKSLLYLGEMFPIVFAPLIFSNKALFWFEFPPSINTLLNKWLTWKLFSQHYLSRRLSPLLVVDLVWLPNSAFGESPPFNRIIQCSWKQIAVLWRSVCKRQFPLP